MVACLCVRDFVKVLAWPCICGTHFPEVCNSVMSSTSKFSMEQPWLVFFMALHLEDLKQLWSSPDKDPRANDNIKNDCVAVRIQKS